MKRLHLLQGIYTSAICTAIVTRLGFQWFATNADLIAFTGSCVCCKLLKAITGNNRRVNPLLLGLLFFYLCLVLFSMIKTYYDYNGTLSKKLIVFLRRAFGIFSTKKKWEISWDRKHMRTGFKIKDKNTSLILGIVLQRKRL